MITSQSQRIPTEVRSIWERNREVAGGRRAEDKASKRLEQPTAIFFSRFLALAVTSLLARCWRVSAPGARGWCLRSPRDVVPEGGACDLLRAMPKGVELPEDLRWRIVYSIWWDQLDFAETACSFSTGPMQIGQRAVEDTWNLFELTGDVASRRGQRAAPPVNRVMDMRADMELIDVLLDAPEATLYEQHAAFEAETGLTVHISTFCQSVRRLGFSRKKVRGCRGRRRGCRGLIPPCLPHVLCSSSSTQGP